MSPEPRYTTLQDYVRVLRHHTLLIAVVTALGGVIALGLSLAESAKYEASSTLSFRDPLANVDIFTGDDSAPEEQPLQRATVGAGLITREEVTARVVRELDTDLAPAQLADSISTQVNPSTNLVEVTASSGDAEFAAALANAYTREARRVEENSQQRRLADAERLLEDQLREEREDLPGSTFQVGLITNQLQRVRLLRETSEPVVIERSAEVPADPVSPRPVRNTILGALVGLLLGLLAAFVRDALDRRIRNPQDVHAELGRPVLSRVSETTFGYHGLVANNGLVMRPEDFEAFRVLRTRLSFLDERGPRSVLVTSANAEEGKTTVAVALASAAAVAGQRVLLVEADLRRPCFERRLGIAGAPGLTDYLQGDAEPREILRVLPLNDPPDLRTGDRSRNAQSNGGAHLVCIPAGSPTPKAPELLAGERFRAFVEKVTRAYDLVVLDTSPILAVADPLQLATMVDGVLVCVRANRTSKVELHATREALGNIPEERAGAVITGIKRSMRDDYGYTYGY